MKPVFHPTLINGPFEDPGLYIEIKNEKDALLFDLGKNFSLPHAKLLRTSSIFVSHTHMDHFMGFDHIIYLFHGRDKKLKIFGPEGITRNVAGKLSGYTWNLVNDYQFVLEVYEVTGTCMSISQFKSSQGFCKSECTYMKLQNNTILETPLYSVHTAILDHKIPSLAFSLLEKIHININKVKLNSMRLIPDKWLNELKDSIRSGKPDNTNIIVPYQGDHTTSVKTYTLKELRDCITIITKGQKISYVVDALYSKENEEKILNLIHDSDILFCEATFLDKDKERAKTRYHLTAKEAGILAKKAGVKRLVIFHFSPKYIANVDELYHEAMNAMRD
ncbi:MAG: MBL fold metallo-hydrolase [Thermodesulfobacteriota bacterium]|nr:MBL fold metallo-hydrolase [Thermodesulfobacteriota bacterium]